MRIDATTVEHASRFSWNARHAYSVLRGTSSTWAVWRCETPWVCTSRSPSYVRSGWLRMVRKLPGCNPYLYHVRGFLGLHRDEMADAVIEAKEFYT
jgi:hypothetical protein